MNTILNIILMIHSITRWIIVIVGVIAAAKFALGGLGRTPYRPMDRGLMSGFTGLMDLQLLLGAMMLIGFGLEPYRLEHALTMLVAVILAHLSVRWRNAADVIKFRNNFLLVVGVFLLIFLGIAVLPQGWFG